MPHQSFKKNSGYKSVNTSKFMETKKCNCGCPKSISKSTINNSNHPDPFKAVNYNNKR